MYARLALSSGQNQQGRHRAPADGNANLTEERPLPPSPRACSLFLLSNLSFSSTPCGETYRSKLSTQSYGVCAYPHSWLRNINSEIIMIFQGFASRGEGIITLLLVKPIYIFLCVILALSLFSCREQSYELVEII